MARASPTGLGLVPPGLAARVPLFSTGGAGRRTLPSFKVIR